MTNELRISVRIDSRYQICNASGQLPFGILFGLCRRSPADTDPRPLLVQVAGSVLDVPYALAHALLSLHVQEPENPTKWVQVDVRRLPKAAITETTCLSLSSPVNREKHWRSCVTAYHCASPFDAYMASILEPGRRDAIKLASNDLGVQRSAYTNEEHLVKLEGKLCNDTGIPKTICGKGVGKAMFKVVKSLSWPPKIEMSMSLCMPSQSLDQTSVDDKLSSSAGVELKVSVINTSTNTVTVQTNGDQLFLSPRLFSSKDGWFETDPSIMNDRDRIIHASPSRPPTSSHR